MGRSDIKKTSLYIYILQVYLFFLIVEYME